MADIYAAETAPFASNKEIMRILEKRRRLELLRAQMENERSSFIPQWRDLNDNFSPSRGRFFTADTNRGDRRNLKIIDSTPPMAARTLRSGLLSGITNPARAWFHLITGDDDLDEVAEVKDWLYEVGRRMVLMFLRTNLYKALPLLYGDMGVFGTAVMMVEEDFKRVMRFHVFPIGSYCIANDDKGKVSVFYREFRLTIRQMIDKFAQRNPDGSIVWDNFSLVVQNLYLNGNTEAWVDIVHFILPNEHYDPLRLESKHKKFASIYYERGVTSTASTNYTTPADQSKFLSEKGYDYFPVLCARWEVTGEDVYATDCPGMTSVGDAKQLQVGEKREMQAIEKMVNPPMTGPSALKNEKASILPGDITYVDEREGQKGFRPAHEVRPDIDKLEGKQEAVRQRVKKSFYEDLFLMLADDDRRQPGTAEEVREKKDEKLVALGSALTNFNEDVLDVLIELGFMFMLRQGRIPPPPQQLRGREIQAEYLSVLAAALKAADIGGLDRFSNFVTNLATNTQDPSVWDKVNRDTLIEVYGDRTSTPPGIVNSDEQVQQIRSARAAQQQKAAQLQQVEQAAGAAKDLAAAKTDEPSALTELMQRSQAGQLVQ